MADNKDLDFSDIPSEEELDFSDIPSEDESGSSKTSDTLTGAAIGAAAGSLPYAGIKATEAAGKLASEVVTKAPVIKNLSDLKPEDLKFIQENPELYLTNQPIEEVTKSFEAPMEKAVKTYGESAQKARQSLGKQVITKEEAEDLLRKVTSDKKYSIKGPEGTGSRLTEEATSDYKKLIKDLYKMPQAESAEAFEARNVLAKSAGIRRGDVKGLEADYTRAVQDYLKTKYPEYKSALGESSEAKNFSERLSKQLGFGEFMLDENIPTDIKSTINSPKKLLKILDNPNSNEFKELSNFINKYSEDPNLLTKSSAARIKNIVEKSIEDVGSEAKTSMARTSILGKLGAMAESSATKIQEENAVRKGLETLDLQAEAAKKMGDLEKYQDLLTKSENLKSSYYGKAGELASKAKGLTKYLPVVGGVIGASMGAAQAAEEGGSELAGGAVGLAESFDPTFGAFLPSKIDTSSELKPGQQKPMLYPERMKLEEERKKLEEKAPKLLTNREFFEQNLKQPKKEELQNLLGSLRQESDNPIAQKQANDIQEALENESKMGKVEFNIQSNPAAREYMRRKGIIK